MFNSNWNFEKYVYQFKIPESKSLVIKNAIEKIDFQEKPKDKINLIYHTTPWRGLIHLLKVFKSLNLMTGDLSLVIVLTRSTAKLKACRLIFNLLLLKIET